MLEFLTHTSSIILHHNPIFSVLTVIILLLCDSQPDPSVCFGELKSIRKQIIQDLPDPVPVAVDPFIQNIDLNVKLFLLSNDLSLIDRNQFFRVRPDIKLLITNLKFSLLHFGNLQYIID